MTTRQLSILVLTVVLTIALASCRNTDKVLGTIALKDQEEVTFDVQVPPYVEAGTGWRLRFGIIPWEQFKTLKPSEQITVYLENTDDIPVNFLIHLGQPTVSIRPKAKVEIFRGELSEFLIRGRGADEEMAFAPMERNVKCRLHFVPRLGPETSYTIRLVIFYYSSAIL